MKEQNKKRKRIIVKRVKGPELVRSVKTSMTSGIVASSATVSAALLHFQDLWK